MEEERETEGFLERTGFSGSGGPTGPPSEIRGGEGREGRIRNTDNEKEEGGMCDDSSSRDLQFDVDLEVNHGNAHQGQAPPGGTWAWRRGICEPGETASRKYGR